MVPGVDIEVIGIDNDLVELEVRASNGIFAGRAKLYENHEASASAAQLLSGFPIGSTDQREVTLGTLDEKYAGGGAGLAFRCTDGSGHCVVKVRLRDDDFGGSIHSATFSIPCEAAAVDEFVQQLRAMTLNLGSNAHLHAAV